MRFAAAFSVMAALVLASCSNRIEVDPPVRVETAPQFQVENSTMRVPLAISLDQLQSALQDRIPNRLWSIDERRDDCIPSQSVRPLGIEIRLTPDISCRIIGQVNRGRITLSGRGRDLAIRLPINASLRAQDIGNVLEGETATGSAIATLRARLSVSPDWRLRANIDVSYDWDQEPGAEFLGQRISFTAQADRELQGLVDSLEQELEREFSRIQLRPFVDNAWAGGFTTIALNQESPPAWMRITPQALGVEGYHFEGRQMLVDISLSARTETVIGERPEAPAPTPLPALSQDLADNGLHLSLPVLAQYSQLEPVVLAALQSLAEQGLSVPGVGPVDADFTEVQIYASEGGRIAVGISARVTPKEGMVSNYGSADGQVWLTGIPFNEAGSAVFSVQDLTILGDTDRNTVDLLTSLFFDEEVRAGIEAAMVGDFSREYESVIEEVRGAVAELSAESVRLSVTIEDVSHGQIQATGAGLFLPITANGTGRISANIE